MKDRPKILVYTAVGGSNLDYCELPRLLHKSLRLHHDKTSVDFAVICPDQHWNELNIDEIHLNLHGSNPVFDDEFPIKPEDPMFWAAAKFTIEKFKIFHDYDIILHLDADIIICKSLDVIFNSVQANKFHVRQEGDLYDPAKGLHSKLVKTAETKVLKTLKCNNIQTFNSGQYMFKPTDRIKNILNTCHENWANDYIKYATRIRKKINVAIGEQPYLNDQFIFKNSDMLEYETFGINSPVDRRVNPDRVILGGSYGWKNTISDCDKFCNEPWWPGELAFKLKRLPLLWHFTAGGWEDKLKCMRECYGYIKPLYDNCR